MTHYLTLEDLLALVDDLSIEPVRDLGLLESAAARAKASLWGEDAYPSMELKAATLLESLVRNHPLVDGNKRLGWLATLVFLDLNGIWIEAPDDDAFEIVVSIASGAATLEQIAASLKQWQVPEREVGPRVT